MEKREVEMEKEVQHKMEKEVQHTQRLTHTQ
jgi:hypothetical protein